MPGDAAGRWVADRLRENSFRSRSRIVFCHRLSFVTALDRSTGDRSGGVPTGPAPVPDARPVDSSGRRCGTAYPLAAGRGFHDPAGAGDKRAAPGALRRGVQPVGLVPMGFHRIG